MIFCRYLDMPVSTKAFTSADRRGDYNIFLNSRLSYEDRRKAYDHEVRHILCDHFRSDVTARQAEREVQSLSARKSATGETSLRGEREASKKSALASQRGAEPRDKGQKGNKAPGIASLIGASEEEIALVERMFSLTRPRIMGYRYGKLPCPEALDMAVAKLLENYRSRQHRQLGMKK